MKLNPVSRTTLLTLVACLLVIIIGMVCLPIWRVQRLRPNMPVMVIVIGNDSGHVESSEESLIIRDNPGEVPQVVSFDADSKKDYIGETLRKWAQKDPFAAADYAAHHVKALLDVDHPLMDVMEIYGKQNLRRAREFVDQLKGSELYDIAMGGYLLALAEKKPNEAMSIATMELQREQSVVHATNAAGVVNVAWAKNQNVVEMWVETLPTQAQQVSLGAIAHLKMENSNLTLDESDK